MDTTGAFKIFQDPVVKNIVLLLFIVGIGSIFVKLAMRAATLAGQRLGLSELAERPIRSVIFWIGLLVIVAAVLRQFQVDVITALTAVLGLVAIGFVAMWSVLSHLTSTFILLLTRPFAVNDRIEFAGDDKIRGRVKGLTTVFTVLEDEEGGIFYIPNNFFFQKAIRHLPPEKTEPPAP